MIIILYQSFDWIGYIIEYYTLNFVSMYVHVHKYFQYLIMYIYYFLRRRKIAKFCAFFFSFVWSHNKMLNRIFFMSILFNFSKDRWIINKTLKDKTLIINYSSWLNYMIVLLFVNHEILLIIIQYHWKMDEWESIMFSF